MQRTVTKKRTRANDSHLMRVPNSILEMIFMCLDPLSLAKLSINQHTRRLLQETFYKRYHDMIHGSPSPYGTNHREQAILRYFLRNPISDSRNPLFPLFTPYIKRLLGNSTAEWTYLYHAYMASDPEAASEPLSRCKPEHQLEYIIQLLRFDNNWKHKDPIGSHIPDDLFDPAMLNNLIGLLETHYDPTKPSARLATDIAHFYHYLKDDEQAKKWYQIAIDLPDGLTPELVTGVSKLPSAMAEEILEPKCKEEKPSARSAFIRINFSRHRSKLSAVWAMENTPENNLWRAWAVAQSSYYAISRDDPHILELLALVVLECEDPRQVYELTRMGRTIDFMKPNSHPYAWLVYYAFMTGVISMVPASLSAKPSKTEKEEAYLALFHGLFNLTKGKTGGDGAALEVKACLASTRLAKCEVRKEAWQFGIFTSPLISVVDHKAACTTERVEKGIATSDECRLYSEAVASGYLPGL